MKMALAIPQSFSPFLLLFIFSSLIISSGVANREKSKHNANFLSLFQDCSVQIAFKLDNGDETRWSDVENIERYIKYFERYSTSLVVENLQQQQELNAKTISNRNYSLKNSTRRNNNKISTLSTQNVILSNLDSIALQSEKENGKKGENKIEKEEIITRNRNTNIKWKPGKITKNLHCSVQMYFIDGLLGQRRDFLRLHKIIEEHLLISKNENPDYIVFVKRKTGESDGESINFKESENGFYSNLYRLSVTSKFLVIDAREKVVKLLCMHCRRDNNNSPRNNDDMWNHKIINLLEIRSLEDLNKLWLEMHLNLQGRSIDALKYQSIIKRGEHHHDDDDDDEGGKMLRNYFEFGCSLYKVGLSTEPNICAQLYISQNLNFTPYTTPQDYRVYGKINSGMMSYSEYNEQIFLNPSRASIKYEWLTTAEYFEPFIYITVVNKDQLNIEALWRPFSKSLWILIISGFIILTFVFAISSSSKYEVLKSRLNHLRYTLILFTAIILQQSQHTMWKFKLGLDRFSKIILIIWIITSMSMSSLYKGTVFSYLATSVPPKIPETTEKLVKSSYFIITTTSYHFQGKVYSMLDGILNEMMIGEDYPKFYQDLKEHAHFVIASHSEIVQAHKSSSKELLLVTDHLDDNNNHNVNNNEKFHGEIMIKKKQEQNINNPNPNNGNPIKTTEKHLIRLPEKFAVIGSEFDVETLMSLLETFTTSFVQKSKTVNTFLNRMPWIVKRNFFAIPFQSKLAHLYESGIYTRWRKMNQLAQTFEEFQNVQKTILAVDDNPNNGVESTPVPGKEQEIETNNEKYVEAEFKSDRKNRHQHHTTTYNYLSLLFSGMKIIESQQTLTPKPLSFEIFDSALVFYMILTTGSLCVFLTEWLIYIFLKCLLNVERNIVAHKKM